MASIFSIFKRGLEKSATKVARAVSSLFTGLSAHGAKSFEELELLLISADFGVSAAKRITAAVKDRYDRGLLATDADLVAAARNEVLEILRSGERPINKAPDGKPTVILFVGLNGSGKTTTIGKLASRLQCEGKKVVLAACDTFRAAAVEQLQLWGERTTCQVVSSRHGADPASVAYDATVAALSRNADYLLIDTAGRQHNQRALMDELAKIVRTIKKVYPEAPQEVWLTVDSTLGSNVVSQARQFSQTAGVTGLVLTKLDGTGRGGMTVALHQEFDLPTFYVGLGEQPDELQPFNPEFYADAIFGNSAE
jgi:fused signal recognition particle receptor